MRMVESTSEYSLCRCRCAKRAGMPARGVMGGGGGFAPALPPAHRRTRLDSRSGGTGVVRPARRSGDPLRRSRSGDPEQRARLRALARVVAFVDRAQVATQGGFREVL